MNTQRQTLQQFIAKSQIRYSVRGAISNPNMNDMDPNATHWRCVLSRAGRRMTVPFSQGSAHTKPPKLTDVLNCLALDSSGYENATDFADWAAEYGYNADSRRAEASYRVVARQAASLKRLLGDDLYSDLLYNTESL